MSTTTPNKTARTIVSSATNTAGSTTRGTLDLTTAHGGVVTLKITNGATGPTVQCTCNVLIAHNASTPTAASAGADWKTVFTFGGGTTNNAVTEQHYVVPPGVMKLEVEFTGNTAQSVTVESYMSELTSYTTA